MANERNDAQLSALKAQVDALYLEYVFPVLATLRLGEKPETVTYETKLFEAAKSAGIKLRRYIMPEDLSMEDVTELIRGINQDALLSAFLLLEPLPARLDAAAVKALIDPKKALAPAPIPELLTRVVDAAQRNAK